jgi:hypothetical protein
MTFEMFDSVGVEHIPHDASMVAGYVNGYWPTYAELLVKFPFAHHVSIAVTSGVVADVLDVERGDATPADASNWIREMRNLRRKPIIYTSRSNVPVVQEVCNDAHVAEPFFWVADWTNTPHLVPGSIATQWADGTPQYPGLALYTDTSLVSPNWPGLSQAEPPIQKLDACHLTHLLNTQQARLARDNGWPIWTWNGFSFVLSIPNEPIGTREYANVHYASKRP